MQYLIPADSKPILFNTEMVNALLDGQKTVTRIPVKWHSLCELHTGEAIRYDPTDEILHCDLCGDGYELTRDYTKDEYTKPVYPPYRVGEILWVRETWLLTDSFGPWNNGYMYKANKTKNEIVFEITGQVEKWRPSIHMPKEAARIFLKVTEVRVERLQDITEIQSEKEGCVKIPYKPADGKFGDDDMEEEEISAREIFSELWNSNIKKKDNVLYGWDANPLVWVVEFVRWENAI